MEPQHLVYVLYMIFVYKTMPFIIFLYFFQWLYWPTPVIKIDFIYCWKFEKWKQHCCWTIQCQPKHWLHSYIFKPVPCPLESSLQLPQHIAQRFVYDNCHMARLFQAKLEMHWWQKDGGIDVTYYFSPLSARFPAATAVHKWPHCSVCSHAFSWRCVFKLKSNLGS